MALPDYTTQDAATYKANIDAALILNTKVIEIGTWDMVADSAAVFAHGITNAPSRIRSVKVIIRNDSALIIYDFTNINAAETAGRVITIETTNIVLGRSTNGYFDDTNFDTMGDDGNRGWVTIQYTD